MATQNAAGMNVVITGASSGIGRTTALVLAQAGHRVFAGVRRAEDADALKQLAPGIEPLRVDVTDAAAVRDAAAFVEQHASEAPIVLVNNAGIIIPGPIELVPIERFRRQFEVNVFGHLAMSQAFLPLLRKRRGSRILMVGSMNGRLSVPLGSAYCASKFALRSFTDALRMELAGEGIPVSLLEVGVVQTPLGDKSKQQMEADLAGWAPHQSERYGAIYGRLLGSVDRIMRFASKPEAVARAVLKAMRTRRPRAYYRVGLDAWLAVILGNTLPPWIADPLILRAYGLR